VKPLEIRSFLSKGVAFENLVEKIKALGLKKVV